MKLLTGLILLLAVSTASANVNCNYISSSDGGAHATEQHDSMAITCSDGSFVSLLPEAHNTSMDYAPTPELPVPWSAYAQLGDVLSTAGFLTLGNGVEGNPLLGDLTAGPAGFAALTLAKLGLVAYSRSKPPIECQQTLTLSKFLGAGATANNLAAWALGASTAPAAIVGVMGGALFTHFTKDSTRLECAESIPSFLLSARLQERLGIDFGSGR